MVKVFLVDDEPILLMLAERFLESEEDIELITFNRASELLETVRNGDKPDMIISDIKMPNMSGFDLATVLKDEGFLDDIQFTYCTSFASLEVASEVYGIDGDDLFSYPMYKKPITRQIISFIRSQFGIKAGV